MGKHTGSIILIVVIVAVIAVVAGGIGLFLMKGPAEYKVSYELNDGINDPENPTVYKYGTGAELYAANRDGYIFTGWYSDSGLSQRVSKITTTTSGDLTLYAGWDTSFVGEKLTYTVSGEKARYMADSKVSYETISGTYKITPLMYAYNSGYYVNYDYSIKTGWTTDSDSGDYYTKLDELAWSATGLTETISEKVCTEYKADGDDGTKYKKYVCESDDYTYKLISESSEQYVGLVTVVTHKEYLLTGKEKMDPAKTYSLSVYADEGLTVTGSCEHRADKKNTLTYDIVGDVEFKGWYAEDGTLLSRSKEFVLSQVYLDCKIYAMNMDEPDIVFEEKTVTYTTQVPLSNVTWTFVDGTEQTKKTSDGTFEYTFSEAGLFYIEYTGTDSDGQKYFGTVSIIAGGMIKRTYEWSYNGANYTETLYIKYSDYQYYCNIDVDRSSGSDSHIRQFVTYDDKYVKTLGQDLKAKEPLLSEAEFAQFVLNFVQYIDYVHDSESKGCTEYWKYPVETLFEQCGDCEDTAILYCAIMESCGFDTALFLYTGIQYQDNAHCACGVALKDASGKGYRVDGVMYYYCETTGKGWKIGQIPDGYSNARVVTI